MNNSHWRQKPVVGTTIRLDHPLAQGLVALWPLWEGCGAAFDVVSGRPVATQSAPWIGTSKGWAAQCGSGTPNQSLSLGGGLASLNITGPITLAALLQCGGGSGQTVFDFGLSSNAGCGLVLNEFGGNQLVYYSAGANYATIAGATLGGTGPHLVAVSQAATGANGAAFYVDGVRVGQVSPASFPSSYTGNRWIGANQGSGNFLSGWIGLAGVWSRALSADEHRQLAGNPWQLFAPRPVSAAIPMEIVPGFSISGATSLPAGNAGLVVNLLGYQTGWTGGTTFTVTGATKTAQARTDGTHATVTLTTGSTGTATISDGTYSATIPVVGTSFAATPFSVPSNHPGHITLTLVGSGTGWTTGTTFTVSGVTGVAKFSQAVTDTTHATLAITTGSSTGTLMISDGVSTYPITVGAPSLSVSPSPVVAGGLVTFSGTNTVWTQETASGLFSASGVSGAGITGIVVQSDTLATGFLAGATASGTATFADNSTGATTTATAYGTPSGSLKFAGACRLAAASGSTLFASQATATLRFKFKLLNTDAASATILDFATTSSGGSPLLAYNATTQQLTFKLYCGNNAGTATNSFTVVVPVVPGNGYDFALTLGASDAPKLYLNGILHATAGFSGVATFPYRQLLIGSTASTNDWELSDVAIWDGYEASSSDLKSLASGSENPLQIGAGSSSVACSAWWPLGGGTVNAAPSLSDAWLSDFSSNANTLSLNAGNLSNAAYAAAIAPASPVIAAPMVNTSGKLATVAFTTSQPMASGLYPPLAPVIAVNSTPAFEVNGSPVSVGPATWFSSALSSGFVSYPFQCGSVDRIAIRNGGQNYTSPVATAPGVTLGTPTTAMGVTSYIVRDGGNFSGTPGIGVAMPSGFSGPAGNTGAVARATLSGTAIASVVPSFGGLMGCGEGYTSSSLPTISVGVGTGVQINLTLSAGSLSSATIPLNQNGSRYSASNVVNVYDVGGTGTGMSLTLTFSGGDAVTGVQINNAGTNYTGPLAVTIGPSGSTVSIQPVVSNYVKSIPVVAGGSNLTSAPTITITDSGNTGSGASALAIMSGVSADDVVTYSAADNWCSPSLGGAALGGLAAVTSAAMTNFTGRIEGPVGGFPGWNATPTMGLGFNVGEQPGGTASLTNTIKNRLRQGGGFGVSGSGTLTKSAEGYPISWTQPGSTTLGAGCLSPSGGNNMDATGYPNQTGRYTLQYVDPTVNTANASVLWIYAAASYATVTPISLSGPHADTGAGVTLNALDVTISAGAVTALGTANSTLGSGYQGAYVVLSGGGGTGAVYSAQASGGNIISFTKVCGGSSYTSKPTVTAYGTRVSGSTVTAIFDVEYNTANPPTWSLGVNLGVAAPANNNGNSDGNAQWTLTGLPWVVAPDAATGNAVTSIDMSQPFAVDDNVAKALTVNGHSPAMWRMMDANQSYGGSSNLLFASDLIDANAVSWQQNRTYSARPAVARYCNTDPGSSTYSWSNTKVYGAQAFYTQTGETLSTTGTTTAGSTAVTVPASPGLMVGSAISGAGIPAGATIVQLTAGGTNAVLSAAATATASGVTLSVQNPNYIPLPTTDDGYFAHNNYGSAANAVYQVRFATPHGFATGQELLITGSANVTFTNGVAWNPNGGTGSSCWVTDAYTILCIAFIGAGNGYTPPRGGPQTIAATTETAVDWTVSVSTFAGGPGCVPYECLGQFGRQFGSPIVVNLPQAATDGCIREIARRIHATAGTTCEVHLESGNEPWNGGFSATFWLYELNSLFRYIPQGTDVLSRWTATGSQPPQSPATTVGYGPMMLLAAHAQDVFAAEWVSLGGDPSRLKRWMGSWWGGVGMSQAIANGMTTYGFTADYVVVGPYLDIDGDAPILAACSPAGSATAGAASWPMDALADLLCNWLGFNANIQGYLQGHHAAVQGTGAQIAGYEGAIEHAFPAATPGLQQLQHDLASSPAAYKVEWVNNQVLQRGHQSYAGTGLAFYTKYQLYNNAVPPANLSDTWYTASGTGQPAGRGSSNAFATIQGGLPADNHDHMGGAAVAINGGPPVRNVSPALKAAGDWIAGSGPATPAVASTVPASGASGVATTTSIQVVFTLDMDPSSLSCIVSASGQTTQTCSLAGYNASSFTASFAIPTALAVGVTYTATVNGESRSGTAMAAADQWSFTTADAAPVVASVTPINDDVGVAIGITITATLTGAVNASSVAFTVTSVGGSAVAGTTAFSAGAATFSPTAPLAHDTVYAVSLNASAPDGSAMAPYSWSFTTIAVPPVVVNTIPGAGATQINPLAAITVVFSEAMDPTTLSLTLSPSARLHEPTWNAATLTASWLPIGGLSPWTSYVATVSGSEVDGTTMTGPFQWGFSTGQAPPSGGLIATSGPPERSPQQYRERDVRRAMRDLLMQTGSFDEAHLTMPDAFGFGASEGAAVVVEPDSTTDADLYDGGMATGSIRTARVIVTFLARNPDPELCDDACELLLMVAGNALNGQKLVDGFTIPDKSKFGGWRWLPRTPPERRIVAPFYFGYDTAGWDTDGTAP